MKAALVLPGGGTFPKNYIDQSGLPNAAKDWGVTEFGFHTCLDNGIKNPELTLPGKPKGSVLDGVRSHGFKLRLTRDYNWPRTDTTAYGLAKALSDDVTYFGQDGKQCALGMDIEAHNGAYVIEALKSIRSLRPGRSVFWTMEPNQGGWIKDWPELVALINADPFISVVAQTYDFHMNPYGDNDGIRVNLWDAGISRDKVEVYYGKNLKPNPARWSGVLYDWNNFVG